MIMPDYASLPRWPRLHRVPIEYNRVQCAIHCAYYVRTGGGAAFVVSGLVQLGYGVPYFVVFFGTGSLTAPLIISIYIYMYTHTHIYMLNPP